MKMSPAPLRALAAVGTMLLATACQALTPVNCTQMGADSEVTVTWSPADFPSDARYELCVGQECRERSAPPEGDVRAFLSVPLPEAKGPDKVEPTFQVTDRATGRTLYDRTAQATLRKFTPNGERCDPTAWQAHLRADPKQGLVVVDGAY